MSLTVALTALASALPLAPVGDFRQPVYATGAASQPRALYVLERAGRVWRVGPRGGRRLVLDASRYVRLLEPRNQIRDQGGAFALALPARARPGGPLYLLYTRRDGRVHLDEFWRGRPHTLHSLRAGRRRLIIADVGEAGFEEVNLVSLDAAGPPNFGWPFFEGPRRRQPGGPADLVPPALAKRHGRGMCAIVGGHLRKGRYVYGDVCSGRIRSVRLGDRRGRDDRSEHTTVPYLVSFGRDGAGRLYAVSLSGRVYRVR